MSWSFSALGTVAQINPRLPQDTDETQNVSFLGMASVSEKGVLLEQETRILSETKKGFTYFERNDVLLAKITPCFENGKAVLLHDLNHQVGFGSTEFHVLRPIKDKLDARYLFYMVWSDRFRFFGEKAMKGAAGQKRISTDFLKEFKIPLPPINEQKCIAAILDKADSLRRKRQQAIQLADQFLRSVFLDLFGDPVTNPKGWEPCKFENLIDMITYGLTVRPEYHATGIPLISAKEIRSGTINFNSSPKISIDDFEKLSQKGRPNYQDILFSKTGSIGHCAIVESSEKFAVTQNAARIVPNKKKCEPIFLLSLLRTKYFFDLANREAKGNAVKDLQLGVMKEFLVYAPPIEIQKRYVDIFHKVMNLTDKSLKLNVDADKLFSSVSQKAFAGEL